MVTGYLRVSLKIIPTIIDTYSEALPYLWSRVARQFTVMARADGGWGATKPESLLARTYEE